ncbi:spermine oxidase-like [Chrysoperla carnea]|uniref:spermine oxidase-like n=1 Tax=Chrysoperla carnea TaxID=189513 RepID=UPI001D08E8BA|nr:spermine oxidase-like [Chrysoperla carnea]
MENSFNFSNENRNQTRRTGVLIIGAGIAGLAAAKTLLDNDYHDFIILEAQSKPGGRIQSLHLTESTILEIGAQWIHGTKNPLYTLGKKYHLISEKRSQEGAGIYLRNDRYQYDPKLIMEVDQEVMRILTDCEQFYRSSIPYPKSVGEYLQDRFEEYLSRCENDNEEIQKLKRQIFNWHVRFQVIDNSCQSLNDLSAKLWGSYSLSIEQDHINVCNGYESIIKVLCNMLPKNVLQLGTCVTAIKWNSNTVFIDCKNGQKYEADFVICTIPLGYLKRYHQKLFQPQLPKIMCDAIDKIGFWAINKIFLKFEQKWWGNVQGFQLTWNDFDVPKRQWYHDISGFDELPRCDLNILIGWIGGKGAKIIEDIPEEEVGICCVKLLKKFTGLNVPNPERVIRSKWLSNPYIYGAYCYHSVDCDEAQVSAETLSRPILNENNVAVMTFAGEACHKTNFSTTHGAYESGHNQANIALQKVLNNKNCSTGLTADNIL